MQTPLRVLIVEDNPDDVLLLVRILKKEGFDPEYLEVETAQAIQYALQEKQWDVVLCDFHLPKFSAHGVILMLQEMDLELPLIIVSGTVDENAAIECMRLGARDYIRKENLSRLAPAIHRELAEARIRTSLKQVEIEWRKSWENYRLITESISDLILTCDFQWKINYVNKAVRDLLGNQDPVGQSLLNYIPRDGHAYQRLMMQKRKKGYSGIELTEWEGTDASGRQVVLDVKSQLISENGKPSGVLFIGRNITERKKEAEALKESEDKYRLVVENASEGIIVSREGKLLFVNRSALALAELENIDPSALSVDQFIHPEDREFVMNNHFQRMQGEKVPNVYSFRVIDGKGHTRWVEMKSAIIPWKSKPAILSFLTDITKRIATEEIMKNLLERFNLATHAAQMGVWETDMETGRLAWNDRMYDLYGLTKKDFANTHEAWLGLIHPEDVGAVQTKQKQVTNENKDYSTEFRIIHPDGNVKHIRSYGKVTTDSNGHPLRMTGINYDITEQKQAENRLRESERKYRSLFTEISEGFALHEIICDQNGHPVDYRFLDINPAFEKIIGLEAAHVIGKTAKEVLLQTTIYRIEQYGKVALSGEPISFEGQLKKRDRHYQINAFCPEKGKFAVLFTDITERKKMEMRLMQAQKMEAIGTLAGGIAHDFNNILGAIIGYAGMAQEELPEGSSAGECIDEIFRASDRAKNLVGQILAFSRRDESVRKPLMIVPVIKEIVKLLRAMLPSTIFIRQNFHVQNATILADATQMHQVLLNLCTNAAHAMKEKGGTLTIGLKQAVIDERHPLRSDHFETGSYLEIQVADDGQGIPEAIQTQIFNPFFTTKKTGEGTGMGLAVVHGIVQSYGGRFRLESREGEGTTFFIYLPLLAEQSVQDQAGNVLPAIGGTERILLVDDQDYMVNMLSRSLSRLGYKITAQNMSPEALRLFTENPFGFDLVITDQTMPYLTGADMAKCMLEIRPDLPIILCTGFSASLSAEQARDIGIREYVMKPVIMNEFTRLIRDVLTLEPSKKLQGQ
ncbi:MAG TPA: PAS domain S-box protein [Smithellaceae bacterium]|nr:PAS domain S-box protein [Smithellaceae bacterium]